MPEPFDVLAALIRVDRSPSLALAARNLAAAGVPVFPCVVEGKRPLTRRGFLDASSDPEQVAAWWSRTPDANIGIPTGAASGVVVVDVDVHGPQDGRAAYQRATDAGLVDGAGLLVRTPTGGAHVYFPTTPGREQRSWQAATARGRFPRRRRLHHRSALPANHRRPRSPLRGRGHRRALGRHGGCSPSAGLPRPAPHRPSTRQQQLDGCGF